MKKFPKAVRQAVGQALFDAQTGGKHPNVKPLKGFGGATVLEVVEEDDKFAGVVYVLHAFQKKSRSGRKTQSEDIDKVRDRLKAAEKHNAQWLAEQEQKAQ